MSKHILVIEDDQETGTLFKAMLYELGFKMTHAKNGEAGLELAMHTLPDIILLDMRLPKMKGWEVANALHADAATKDIPIIVISANLDGADSEKIYGANCDAYLRKPFSPMELRDLVQELTAD